MSSNVGSSSKSLTIKSSSIASTASFNNFKRSCEPFGALVIMYSSSSSTGHRLCQRIRAAKYKPEIV
jgi:hypothetical protein